jgi:F-type H+-transporting ATPase subunit a
MREPVTRITSPGIINGRGIFHSPGDHAYDVCAPAAVERLARPGYRTRRIHSRSSAHPLAFSALPAEDRSGTVTITPDNVIYWRIGSFALNATIVFTWFVMTLLVFVSWLITRRLSTAPKLSRWQNLLEVLVITIRDQIRELSHQEPGPYLPFVGTLFLFIATSNLLTIVPGYLAPTGSLSTTTALAITVFVAVPLFGIFQEGFVTFLKHYIRPTILMLPFNIIGELSRTVALAVRLYGNVMSGTVIAGLLLSLTPFFFPIVMQVLGLITGMVQAYIFAVLAMVYIASATSVHARTGNDDTIDTTSNDLR